MSLDEIIGRHAASCALGFDGRWRRRGRRLPCPAQAALLATVLALGLGTVQAASAAPQRSPECSAPAGEPVLRVGAGEAHARVGSAIAAANAMGGTGRVTICVAAGTYLDDFATIKRPMRILGVGGRPHLKATVPPRNRKGILVTNTDAEIVNLELSGAAISARLGQNAAGIRMQGGNLTVTDSFIHGNQNGIMSNNNVTGTIRISGSTITGNGAADGRTHGVYMTSRAGKVLVEDSYFEGQKEGHHIKSRAVRTEIKRSTFEDGIGTINGIPSYSIDVPAGGVAVIWNNTFVQRDVTSGTRTNKFVIHYSDNELGSAPPRTSNGMTIGGNTFRNFRSPATAVRATDGSVPPVVIKNNRFVGFNAVVEGSAVQSGNRTSGFTAHKFGSDTLVGVNAGAFRGGRDAVEHDHATGQVRARLDQPDGIAGNTGITELGGKTYVADSRHGIGVLDPVTGTSTFYSAHGGIEALGDDGENLLAAIFETDELLTLSTDGAVLGRKRLLVPGLSRIGITGLDFGLDRLFVGSFLDGNVYVFDDGFTFEGRIETGIGGGELSGVAFDLATGRLWVSTGYGDDRLRAYDLDGTLRRNIAAADSALGGLYVRGSPELLTAAASAAVAVAAVPVPPTFGLFIAGLALAFAVPRLRRRRSSPVPSFAHLPRSGW